MEERKSPIVEMTDLVTPEPSRKSLDHSISLSSSEHPNSEASSELGPQIRAVENRQRETEDYRGQSLYQAAALTAVSHNQTSSFCPLEAFDLQIQEQLTQLQKDLDDLKEELTLNETQLYDKKRENEQLRDLLELLQRRLSTKKGDNSRTETSPGCCKSGGCLIA